MSDSVGDACSALQAKALALTGVKAAPAKPPEAMHQFPFAVCYPYQPGRLELVSYGLGTWIQTIRLELHGMRVNLPADVALMAPFGQAMLEAILDDPTLGGVTEVLEVRPAFGVLSWNGQENVHIGWAFDIDVKFNLTP